MEIVCAGDCGIDLYEPSGARHVGGITANFARHARDQFDREDNIHIVSCVGDDEAGNRVSSSLTTAGIECHIKRSPGGTPVQHIRIEPDGEKQFVYYDEGVLGSFYYTEEQAAIIASSDLLVTPVFAQITGLFNELLSIETEGRVAVDFADFAEHPDFGLLEKNIDAIDIGFFGLTSDDTDHIDRIARLAERHRKLFIVTLAADGCLILEDRSRTHHAALPVDEVFDTTGAGDAFAAGFLARLCHGAGISESVRAGASLAARVISQVGSYAAP